MIIQHPIHKFVKPRIYTTDIEAKRLNSETLKCGLVCVVRAVRNHVENYLPILLR